MNRPSPRSSRAVSEAGRGVGRSIVQALVLTWFAGLLCAVAIASPDGSVQARVQAPTKLHHQPNVYDIAQLPGDAATMQYSVGQLDRAARLQFRLEPELRALQRWLDTKVDVTTYVLSREHWEQARINMPYGVPVRIGRIGVAAPAEADEAAFQIWAGLGVTLPSVSGQSFRGTPQQESSLVMSDYVTDILISEILVDHIGLAGDKYWVRGLMTHLCTVTYYDRLDEQSLRDIDLFYRQVLESRPPKMLAASDFDPEIDLGDWLWFQARLHYGARIVLGEEGRGVFSKMYKLKKRNGDVLTAAALLERYKKLASWYYDGFAAVSTRPSPSRR